MTQEWVSDYRRALGYKTADGSENQPTPSLAATFVPATFVSCLRDSEFSAFAALELQLSQLLHAGQQYKFHAPVLVNDWITSQTEITRCAKKRGKTGEMVFMDFRNEFRKTQPSADPQAEWAIGELVAESVMTVVVKEGD